MGFNSRWGSIISIFVFDWGFIHIFMGWGCNQEWGFNGADTVFNLKMNFFKIFGHLCLVSDQKFENFLFEVK